MSERGDGPDRVPRAEGVARATPSARGTVPASGEATRWPALERCSWVLTAAFVLTATAAAIAPDPLVGPAAVFDLALFLAGCGAFLWTLLQAARRSRTEELSVGGLWLLTGAPAPVRRALSGALAVQVVTALATAAARPYTPLAFGILVPVLGLGLGGVWAVARAPFPPRVGGAGPVGHNAGPVDPDPRKEAS